MGLVRDPGGLEGRPGRRCIARLEHELAIRVLGDADDPGDVHAPLRERGGHPGERARPIVELDREPDRHRRTSSVRPMVPGDGRADRPGGYDHRRWRS